MQRLADNVSRVFVPIVILLALGAFAVTGSFAIAVAVLIIACPCAMGLAVPAAIMVATGRGASLGLLFKNGEALERLNQIDTIVFDKTGTLTEGTPEVVAYEPAITPDPLPLLAALEHSSEHPLAEAVVRYAASPSLPVSDFQALPGMGAQGNVDGHAVLIGKRALLEERGIDIPGADEHSAQGRTTIWAAVDGQFAATLALADRPRAEAAEVVQQLQSSGYRVLMLTGDQESTAHAIAAQLGITEIVAGVLPSGKLDTLRRLQSEGRRVAMVGDGVNDAPALAAASAGIAMASGADVAIAASDVTLMRADLHSIPRALTLARQTVRVVRQNLFWALFYNVIAIPSAMLGLLTPILASAAMSLSSVSVVTNSLRLSRAARSNS